MEGSMFKSDSGKKKKRKLNITFVYYVIIIGLVIGYNLKLLKWFGYFALIILLLVILYVGIDILSQLNRKRLLGLIMRKKYTEAKKYVQQKFNRGDEVSKSHYVYFMTVIVCHELLELPSKPESIHKIIQDIKAQLNDLENKNALMELSYSFILAALYLRLCELNECCIEPTEFHAIMDQIDDILAREGISQEKRIQSHELRSLLSIKAFSLTKDIQYLDKQLNILQGVLAEEDLINFPRFHISYNLACVQLKKHSIQPETGVLDEIKRNIELYKTYIRNIIGSKKNYYRLLFLVCRWK